LIISKLNLLNITLASYNFPAIALRVKKNHLAT
jgi:hypothetical protein